MRGEEEEESWAAEGIHRSSGPPCSRSLLEYAGDYSHLSEVTLSLSYWKYIFFSFFLSSWKHPELGLSFQIIPYENILAEGFFRTFLASTVCLLVGLFNYLCNLEVVLHWKTATSAQEAANIQNATQINRRYCAYWSRKKFLTIHNYGLWRTSRQMAELRVGHTPKQIHEKLKKLMEDTYHSPKPH